MQQGDAKANPYQAQDFSAQSQGQNLDGAAQGFSVPKVKWRWYVFGNPTDYTLMVVDMTWDPPLWRRILTRIFLGSVWERL